VAASVSLLQVFRVSSRQLNSLIHRHVRVLRHSKDGPVAGGLTQTQNLDISKRLTVNVNKKVQLDATVCRHLFTTQSLYMFRVSQHPSSGVLKTVSATSGIGHDTGTATSFQRGLIGTLWNL